jgi:hypothetical protein
MCIVCLIDVYFCSEDFTWFITQIKMKAKVIIENRAKVTERWQKKVNY